MFCEKCGCSISHDDVYCPECGSPVIFCRACGAFVSDEDDFCPVCGAPVDKTGFVMPESKEKKKSKKVIAISLIAAAAAIVAAVVLVIAMQPKAGKRTMMVYMIGSNLEYDEDDPDFEYSGLASQDLEEILKAEKSDDLNIVIQTGGALKWRNSRIKGGQVQRFCVENNSLKELQNLGAVSMVEEDTLTSFIKYSAEEYPADEYILVFWDHGGGVPNGFGSDEIFPGDALDDVEIGSAIRNSGVHVDATVFNACLMCSLEVYMSIKDCTDYAVAAESVTTGINAGDLRLGSGFNYTNFVTALSNTKTPVVDCLNVLVDDYKSYMEIMKEMGTIGTLSIVKMDRIQAVYDAYARFIKELNQEFQTDPESAFSRIIQARAECGDFDGYDFVDLNMLATKLDMGNYSTNLHNAITNATERTESVDYSNALGITAYFPYELAGLYEYGRESLVTLGYDEEILSFYDTLVGMIDENSVSEDAETVTLSITEDDGDYKLMLSEDDWDIILQSTIRREVYYRSTDGYLHYLGNDNSWTYDEDNNIVLAAPANWLQFNEAVPSSLCVNVIEDEESGMILYEYLVYAYVNDQESFILVDDYISDSDESLEIAGYFDGSFADGAYSNGKEFNGDETVELVIEAYDVEADEWFYRYYDGCKPSELEAQYGAITFEDKDSILVMYTLEDIYGQKYETDMITVSAK